MEADPQQQKCLKGQVAIVTGGGSGIGRAVCLALAREGAEVVVVDLVQSGVQATIAQMEELLPGKEPVGLVLDVTSETDMEKMAASIIARLGRIDILVHCAGILRLKGTSPRPMHELSMEEWEVVISTNLTGTFLSNRAVLPAMIAQRRGHIINLSSTSGKQGRPFDSAYCASKFGVIGLSESLAEEVRQYKIKVHTVLPDAVDTALWEQNKPIPRPAGALPAERVADLMTYLLLLPEDTILLNPIVARFQSNRRSMKVEGAHSPAAKHSDGRGSANK